MRRDRYSNLPRKDLELLFEFYLRKFQRIDGYWFSGVEDRFGTEQAVEINSEVWGKAGTRDAEIARRMFNVTGDGIPALIDALQKTFIAFADWEMEQVSDTHAIFRVTACYPQKARLAKRESCL